MTTISKLDAALAYASWGWHVLPIRENDKRPATEHGVHDATTDQEKIKAWWGKNPNYNIGIAAGEKSGLVVFDVDPRNGGDDSWHQFVSDHGKSPDGVCQLTAGGGEHHIAVWQDGIKSCELRPGVDLLANGRYFIASPSTINGKEYIWEASSDPFDGIEPFKIPDQWMAAMSVRKVIVNATDGALISGNRNAGLTALAGSMRRYGFSESEIHAALVVANSSRCEIPLPASEVQQIAHSVVRYEPESDLAADTALGASTAEKLLATPKIHPLSQFVNYDMSDIPAQEYVLDGLIQAGVVLIAGSAGAGKTTQLVPLACRVAHLCNASDSLKPLLRRKVIWVSEDPKQVLRILRSMRESGHFGGKSDAEVFEWFKIVPAARLAPEIVAQVAPLYEEMAYDNISEDGVVYRANPLVVFDTINSSIDLDNESDNSEVGRAMATLKQQFDGIPIWLIAHLAKALKRADVADFSARGAGAWEADANQVLYIIKEDDGKRWLEIESAKHRFMAKADGIMFEAAYNKIVTQDMLGNQIEESLIHGVPVVIGAGGRADLKKQREADKKRGEEFARMQAENERKQIAIDELRVLAPGEYLTKTELFARMKGDKGKTFALIDRMVQAREIEEIFKPFPKHIKERAGRHDSGFMMPKSYKKESDGD